MSNNTRRTFLKNLFAATVVVGAGMPALAKVDYAHKIKTLIRMSEELIAMYKELNPTDKPLTWQAWEALEATEYNAKFDELFAYGMNNFKIVTKDEPEEYALALESTKIIFTRGSKESWKDVPPTLHETSILIGVARELLSVHRLRLNPSKMKQFEIFADKFQDLILAA